MQIIADGVQKIKLFIDEGVGEWGLIMVVFLVGIGAFALGRISVLEDARPVVSLTNTPLLTPVHPMYAGGLYVASRSGTVYYYPWCTGADTIELSKQVWFETDAAARRAGYAPAKSCKGLSP